ncbi:MAG: MgtC/SapB family protein [Bacillota bacterium]|nr:MAG: MgtC/SapB family protein [Bacillota bacterium]
MGATPSEFETILRLALAFVLGAVLGFERETHDRPAGLRTFILVAVGSTLIMVVSISLRDLYAGAEGVDPGRIAAQVVTGIGFLGAGTIIHEGPFIKGLTTAAGLWVVAAIGLAVGSGFYLAAVATTVLSLISLTLLARVERYYIGAKGYGLLTVVTDDTPGQLGRVASALGEKGVNIKDIRMSPVGEATVEIELRVKAPSRDALQQSVGLLMSVKGVHRAEYAG